MIKKLWSDEAGVILSAEIVLVGTILVVGMVVGLVELQSSVVDELNDLGEAIGAINQGYSTASILAFKQGRTGVNAETFGSQFRDQVDSSDGNECDIVCFTGGQGERPQIQ